MKLPCDFLSIELKEFACCPDGGVTKWDLTFRRSSFDCWESHMVVPSGEIRRSIKFVAFCKVQCLAEIEGPPPPPAVGPPPLALEDGEAGSDWELV